MAQLSRSASARPKESSRSSPKGPTAEKVTMKITFTTAFEADSHYA